MESVKALGIRRLISVTGISKAMQRTAFGTNIENALRKRLRRKRPDKKEFV